MLYGGAFLAPAPPIKFGVISDIHFFDARLGTTGSDWEAYLDKDPKLLVESEAILDSALQSLVDSHVNFVLVPGDMTKYGELLNHVRVGTNFSPIGWLMTGPP